VRFPRSHRLTRDAELRVVAREGKRIRAEHVELRWTASLFRHPRVGFIVPKHGHTAVDRNRLKRRLREIVRVELLARIPAVDVVVRTRPTAYAASFAALRSQLRGAADRLCAAGGAS
jgi:ribonuclease P protein component